MASTSFDTYWCCGWCVAPDLSVADRVFEADHCAVPLSIGCVVQQRFTKERMSSAQVRSRFEAVQGGGARGAQPFDDWCAPMLIGDDLDAPRSLVSGVDGATDEGGGIEIASAAIGPAVYCVVDDVVDGSIGPVESVIDFDGDNAVDGHQFPQIVVRQICFVGVPDVDH